MSETVLRRLIAQKIYYFVKNVGDNDARSLQERTIYAAGQPCNYFVMILEGKTKVTVGSEALMFDAGPFTYFGTSALRLTGNDIRSSTTTGGGTRPPTPESPGFGSTDIKKAIEANRLPVQPGADPGVTFRPDFSVVIVEPTLYMKVPRNVYCAAYRATLLEYQKGCPPDEEKLQREIDKAFIDDEKEESPETGRKDYHIAGEKEKLLSEGQFKTNGNSPHSERRPSSPQTNPPPPVKRKNSLAALARLPAQAAAAIFTNNTNKAPSSPLSNYPPTLSLSSKVTPTPDRKPTPPSQPPAQVQKAPPPQPLQLQQEEPPPSPTKYNPNNRRNGSPSKESPIRGRSPSPPSSPKEDSALISKPTTKPN